jgi:ParB/RepB/Spo0J family partition protein
VKYLLISKIRLIARRPFERADLGDDFDELVASIKKFGILTPIEVRVTPKGYVVVLGRRRVQAARKLGFKEIPAFIVDGGAKEAQEVWECSSWSGPAPRLRKVN